MTIALIAVVAVAVAFLSAAGWKLGATTRGIGLLVLAAAVGVVGRVFGVEEFVLLAAAAGVVLALGPLVLWQRAQRAAEAVRVEVRAGAHEVAVDGVATIAVQVVNTGGVALPPLRLESPVGRFTVRRPGLQSTDTQPVRRAGAMPGGGSGRRVLPLAPGWFGLGLPANSFFDHLRTFRRLVRALTVPALAPGAAASCSFSIPTEERGLVTMPKLGLWCQDPFRLFANQVAETHPAIVVVFPTPVIPDELPDILERASLGVAEAQNPDAQLARTSGSDLAGLRPYVPGDRLRLLHWPTLARTGALVVRYFESSSAGVVTVVVDDRLDVHDPDAFERAVEIAAGFCVEANAQGFAVDLRTASGDRFVLPPSAFGRQALLRALATLEPGLKPIRQVSPVAARLANDEHQDSGVADRLRRASTPFAPRHAAAMAQSPIIVTTEAALGSLPDAMRRAAAVVVAR